MCLSFRCSKLNKNNKTHTTGHTQNKLNRRGLKGTIIDKMQSSNNFQKMRDAFQLTFYNLQI